MRPPEFQSYLRLCVCRVLASVGQITSMFCLGLVGGLSYQPY